VVCVVSFDCYGTLVDWLYGFGSLFRFLFGDGWRCALDRFLSCEFRFVSSGVYVSYSDVLRRCFCECFSDFCCEEYCDAVVSLFAKSPPFPDSVIGLRLLRKLGVKVVVFSNTERRLIEVTLRGLEDLVDLVVTAEDLKCYKPSVECFRRFLKYINADPGEILHVSAYPEYDLEPASKLGMRTLLVDRYGRKWSPAVKNIVEVYEYVKNLLKTGNPSGETGL